MTEIKGKQIKEKNKRKEEKNNVMKVLNGFKDYLILQGYSNYSYYDRIKEFLRAVKTTKITQKIIDNFIIAAKNKYSAGSINQYIYALKKFLKFLNITDITLPPSRKVISKLPDSITEEYFEKEIIPIIPPLFPQNELQVKTILYFMFYTGVRRGEMRLLKRENFDLMNRTVKIIIPKTKEERLVIFSPKVKIWLQTYFAVEPERDNALNVSKYQIRCIFDKLKPNCRGVRMRPHIFRHSFITMCLKKGIDVTVIQKLVGHKLIDTTLRYLDLNINTVKELYDKKFK